jgi:hypothetical protein
VGYAISRGARIVEGYPLDKEHTPDPYACYGLASMFTKAGFQEVARPSPNRPIMRYRNRPPKAQAPDICPAPRES